MANPIPQFNTPLAPDQLNKELPLYPIYGVTPDNKYTPISITENGQLSIGSVTITGPVTVSDVVIKGVDPDNSFVSEDVAVFNLGAGNGWSMRSTLFDGANHLSINPDGSINTNLVTSVNPSTNLNIFSQNTAVAGNSTVTLFTYTVPASHTYQLGGIVAWGTYDAEFLITINGSNVGGGWSSPTNRTLQVNYGSNPIFATAGQVVAVTVTNFASSTQTFRINVLADLLS